MREAGTARVPSAVRRMTRGEGWGRGTGSPGGGGAGELLRGAGGDADQGGGAALAAGLADEDLGAGVGAEDLLHLEGGAGDEDAAAAGYDAGEGRARRVGEGPEGAEHGGGEVVEDGIARGVERHRSPADDEGVAVLEDGDLADGEAAGGLQGDGGRDAVGGGGGGRGGEEGGEGEGGGEGGGGDPHGGVLRERADGHSDDGGAPAAVTGG
ncbi:MAG: hypothetical protein L6R43_06790 [Planctomycetes bacterium]|nr:hypothetical protein [Planctomycetota bacterium]